MQEEKELTSAESLRLINEMIGKAKADYRETGVSALLWGSVVIFCSIITLLNFTWQLDWLRQIWMLTLIAVIPQIVISAKEKKRQLFVRDTDTAVNNIWLAFGIAIGLLSFYAGLHQPASGTSLFIILYGMPTLATGLTVNFRPMIIGGIVCWLCAVLSFYTPLYYDVVLTAVAAFFAWLLPGIILRRRYLHAKQQHV